MEPRILVTSAAGHTGATAVLASREEAHLLWLHGMLANESGVDRFSGPRQVLLPDGSL